MKVWKTEKIIQFHPKLAKIAKNIDNNISISNSNKNSTNKINNPKQKLSPKLSTTKKTKLFKVETFEEYYSSENQTPNSGRWTLKEHILFLQALDKYGVKWKKFQKMIKTRTANQIRSHCQKFFKRLKHCKDAELGIDFTSDNINNMNDVINHIKSVNKNKDVVNVLLYISGKYPSNFFSRRSTIIEKAVNVNNLFEDDIKSNNDNEINSNKVLQINEANKLYEEKRNKQQSINNSLNNNNSFKQNTNFFNYNYNIYNSLNIYSINAKIMNFVNNINNNIILGSNIQNLNNIYVSKDNQKNESINKISEKNTIIDIDNVNDCLDINNIKN